MSESPGFKFLRNNDIATAVDEFLSLERNYTERENFCLKETTLITDEFLAEIEEKDRKAWLFIKALYESDGGPFTMALASIANAILTQGRYIFVTSQRTLWELVQNDPNHKKEFKLHYRNYKQILSYLYKTGLMVRIEKSKGRKVGVFRVESLTFIQFLFDDYLEYQGWTWDSPEFQKSLVKECTAVYEFRDRWEGR